MVIRMISAGWVLSSCQRELAGQASLYPEQAVEGAVVLEVLTGRDQLTWPPLQFLNRARRYRLPVVSFLG